MILLLLRKVNDIYPHYIVIVLKSKQNPQFIEQFPLSAGNTLPMTGSVHNALTAEALGKLEFDILYQSAYNNLKKEGSA